MVYFKKFDCLFHIHFVSCYCVLLFLPRKLKAIVMKFTMKDVHVGNLIHDELEQQGRTVVWFAKQIYCEKSNVYKMFKRKSIDLFQLMHISEVLDHNFLKDCYEES